MLWLNMLTSYWYLWQEYNIGLQITWPHFSIPSLKIPLDRITWSPSHGVFPETTSYLLMFNLDTGENTSSSSTSTSSSAILSAPRRFRWTMRTGIIVKERNKIVRRGAREVFGEIEVDEDSWGSRGGAGGGGTGMQRSIRPDSRLQIQS